jgi:hypothetical protein
MTIQADFDKLEKERADYSQRLAGLEVRLRQAGRGEVGERLKIQTQISDARRALELLEGEIAGLRPLLDAERKAAAERDRQVKELLPVEAEAMDRVVAGTRDLVEAFEDLEKIRGQIIGLGGMAKSQPWTMLYRTLLQAETYWQMFGILHGQPGSVNRPPAGAKARKAAPGKPERSAGELWQDVRARLKGV